MTHQFCLGRYPISLYGIGLGADIVFKAGIEYDESKSSTNERWRHTFTPLSNILAIQPHQDFRISNSDHFEIKSLENSFKKVFVLQPSNTEFIKVRTSTQQPYDMS